MVGVGNKDLTVDQGAPSGWREVLHAVDASQVRTPSQRKPCAWAVLLQEERHQQHIGTFNVLMWKH